MIGRCSMCKTSSQCAEAARLGMTVRCMFFSEILEMVKRQSLSVVKSTEVRRTCYNCTHHHGNLSDDTCYHIHDYCDVWRTEIPSTVVFDKLGFQTGFDDLECGIAHCWAFDPKKDGIVSSFASMSMNGKAEEKKIV